MITQEAADLTLQRIALTSLLYYPEITADDPTYKLEDEVNWCIESLNPEDQKALRDLVIRTVLNPAKFRAVLFSRVTDLTPAET